MNLSNARTGYRIYKSSPTWNLKTVGRTDIAIALALALTTFKSKLHFHVPYFFPAALAFSLFRSFFPPDNISKWPALDARLRSVFATRPEVSFYQSIRLATHNPNQIQCRYSYLSQLRSLNKRCLLRRNLSRTGLCSGRRERTAVIHSLAGLIWEKAWCWFLPLGGGCGGLAFL